MAESKIFRLVVLLVVFTIFWIMGLREHKDVQPNSSDAIYLPRWLGLPFGKSGSGRIYSIRGIVGQLLIFSVAVIYSLNILEYISDKELARYFLIAGLILSFLWLLLFVIFGSKRSS